MHLRTTGQRVAAVLLCVALTACSSTTSEPRPTTKTPTSDEPRMTSAEAKQILDKIELTDADFPKIWTSASDPTDGTGDPDDPKSFQDCWIGSEVTYDDVVERTPSTVFKDGQGLLLSTSGAVWATQSEADDLLDAAVTPPFSACLEKTLLKIKGVTSATMNSVKDPAPAGDSTIAVTGRAERARGPVDVSFVLIRSESAVTLLGTTSTNPARTRAGFTIVTEAAAGRHRTAFD